MNRLFIKIKENRMKLAGLMIFFLLLSGIVDLYSDRTGKSNRTTMDTGGCGGTGCHGTTIPNPATVLAISSGTGYYKVTPNTIINFTVDFRNDLALAAGINISIKDISGNNIGTLYNVQSDLKLLDNELAHTAPKVLENGRTSFQFSWKAPAQQGTYNIYVAACGVNQDGRADAQDMWSWMLPQEIIVDAGPPILAAIPGGIDFGEIKLTRYKDTTMTIRNTGKNPLTVSGIEMSGTNAKEFILQGTVKPFELLPDSSTKIRIRFMPKDMNGAKSAGITFTNNSNENPKVIPLFGKCTSQPMPKMQLTTELMNFGDVKVSEFKEIELIIKNTGDDDLTVNSANLSGTNAKEFSFGNSANFLLKPDSSYTLIVRFNPQVMGSKAAQFNFSSNSQSDPIIYLIGNALPGPNPVMLFSINVLEFDKAAVGTHADKSVIIKNGGEFSLDVTGIKIIGPNAAEFKIVSGGGAFSITGGDQRTMTIRFEPVIDGLDKSGVILFTCNDATNPKLNLTGSAYYLPSPQITTSLDNINFGNLMAGKMKDTSFIIHNLGNVDLRLDQPVTTGKDSLDFLIMTQSFPRLVKPSDSLSFRMRFYPLTAGTKSATLKLVSNDKDVFVSLAGSANPSEVNNEQSSSFISLYPNPASSFLTISIRNDFATSLMIYDEEGREVFCKDNFNREYLWNLYDQNGMRLANGRYFISAKLNNEIIRIPFIIVR